ncbi:MAG: hypothetical protein DMG10_27045 [Acidobacteria bacterium]|nr:MAG: hypothetical protein DMG10_27045 [Acidobacteriota bacterium]
MLAPVFHRWELSLSRKDRNRTVRPFEWGIEFLQNGISNRGFRTADCGLNDGNPQSEIRNPKSYLIDYARRAVRESDAYHSYAPVKDYRLEGSHLTFSSPLQTAYPRKGTSLWPGCSAFSACPRCGSACPTTTSACLKS